ncbi:glycoside hydrolase family 95 protein [Bacteroides acidifaciens]|uniref:glycoside hydrolase family 95 protein n=1 Tax=Bacteroides acidifaciens TaxID=85831 RepID=UPI0023C56523|nr:glycoside hydrolase family 95 protein [Bacteroides acidifaciens]MDE6822552.1 glycoside hydrolase family 95 protein [Bacteroides acidifaciens]
MKVKSLLFSGWMLFSAVSGYGKDYKLWYDAPATVWEEALPLGNGRIGAMVYGNPTQEVYQLNEETLWSGYPQDCNNPKAAEVLPLVRKAVDEGDYVKASALWKANAQGPYTARYLPLANLMLSQPTEKQSKNIYRDLNISNATATVTYEADGVKYRRTSFISYPDQVMVVKMEADKKQSVSLDVRLNSLLRYQVKATAQDELLLDGKAPSYVANRDYDPRQVIYHDQLGLKFKVKVKLLSKGGTYASGDSLLSIRNADEVTLLLSAATDFYQPEIKLNDCNRTYEELIDRHLKDYQPLFNRVDISLGKSSSEKEKLPTSQRLKQFAAAPNDNGLLELYYQYGRYLMIASSRPGGLPANLQGIWNHRVQPPWGSNYTTNINTEMNYWMTETANLPECFTPLSDFIRRLSVNGAQTAKINYGMDRGWLAHHNSDAWAQTAPTGGYDTDPKGSPRWSCWPLAGVWLCQHLWEHYAFGGDRQYLSQTAYPIMKGAAEFLLQWLQKDPETGKWITNPSTSPENRFRYMDKNGQKQDAELSRSSGMDLGLAWDLLTNCIDASRILNTDAAFRSQLEEVRANLQPFRIGSKGQLLEWEKEFEEIDPKHRHVSHLFALHPGRQILPERDTELANACRRTLELRGDGGTGWAMAWKINFWARLHDGNHAFLMLKNGLKYVDATQENIKGGGTYANLFDAHPPFQIDGNFGGTAGITEMLLQSHAGYIHLLPALPDNWQEGSIHGIRARGGFTIDMEWKKGKITRLSVTSHLGGTCRIREGASEKEKMIETQKGKTYSIQ